MSLTSILKDCKITRVKVPVTAGTAEILSDTVDMAGYDNAIFIAALGDQTSGSVITMTVKSNPTDSTSGGTTEKAGTATTAGASDTDDKLVIVDVLRVTQRYVFASITRTTQNAELDDMICIQYGAKVRPVTQGSTVLTGSLGGPNV